MKKSLVLIMMLLISLFTGSKFYSVVADTTSQTLSGSLDVSLSDVVTSGVETSKKNTWTSSFLTITQTDPNGANINKNNPTKWYKTQTITFTPSEKTKITKLTITTDKNNSAKRLSDSTWSTGSKSSSGAIFYWSGSSSTEFNVYLPYTVTIYSIKYNYSTTQTTAVVINKTQATLNQEATLQLSAEVQSNNNLINSVTWSSSDDSIATVDSNGLVTTKYFNSVDYPSGRDVTITAKASDDTTSTCTVHVNNLKETEAGLRIYHQLNFEYTRELSENGTYKLQTESLLYATGLNTSSLTASSTETPLEFSVSYVEIENRTYFYIYTLIEEAENYLYNSSTSNIDISTTKEDLDTYYWYLDIDGYVTNKETDKVLGTTDSQNIKALDKSTSNASFVTFVGDTIETEFEHVSISYQVEGSEAFRNGVVAKFGTTNLKVKFVVNNQEYICDLYHNEENKTYFSRFTVTDIPSDIWNEHFDVVCYLVAYKENSTKEVVVQGEMIVEENLYSASDIASLYLFKYREQESVKNVAYYLSKFVESLEVAHLD